MHLTVNRSAVIMLLFLILTAGCQPKVQPPNIVIIMTDDQGFGDFGFSGNEIIETPVLDKLRDESMMFDRFYVSPLCAPTRASLLTGRYHLRTGTTWVTQGREIMRPDEWTLAESFAEHGYTTGIFGKWHNGEHYPSDPRGQGFDTFFGFSAGHWNNYFDTKLTFNDQEVQTSGYITDILTDSALSFIEQNRGGPFLCYLPYNAPHGPYQVADVYFDKYKKMGMDDKTAAVYGMCENLDDNIGRVLLKLDDLGLKESTIVVFLTDNGPNGERYNAGMKGIKAQVDEGGVRVPLLIRYPGVVPAGNTITGLASHIDILPTLHGLTGLKFRGKLPLDGIDLSGFIRNEQPIPDRMIFSHLASRTLDESPVSVRTPKYRMVILPNGDTSLYNMVTDPGQENDISALEPAITARLADTIDGWFRDVTGDLPYLPAIPVGHKESPSVKLPATEAILNGGVHYFGGDGWANDWLIGFEKGENSASWKLDVLQAGPYEMRLTYAVVPWDTNENIMVSTEEQMNYFAVPERMNAFVIPSNDRYPRGGVIDRRWPTVKIGSILLKEGEETITISFNGELKSKLEIRELILTRKE